MDIITVKDLNLWYNTSQALKNVNINIEENTITALIGRVLITSKLYSNPWAVFKKGLLEYGETIEEIFATSTGSTLIDKNLENVLPIKDLSNGGKQ